jgi:hypothetical protein
VNSIAPKSPFFKGVFYQQFLLVPPFSKGGLGGIRMMPPPENTLGKRYKHDKPTPDVAPQGDKGLPWGNMPETKGLFIKEI